MGVTTAPTRNVVAEVRGAHRPPATLSPLPAILKLPLNPAGLPGSCRRDTRIDRCRTRLVHAALCERASNGVVLCWYHHIFIGRNSWSIGRNRGCPKSARLSGSTPACCGARTPAPTRLRDRVCPADVKASPGVLSSKSASPCHMNPADTRTEPTWTRSWPKWTLRGTFDIYIGTFGQ